MMMKTVYQRVTIIQQFKPQKFGYSIVFSQEFAIS
jgi:hypothetical protein